MPPLSARALPALACLLWATSATAQTPTLVGDFADGPRPDLTSNPKHFTAVGGRVVFSAETPALGAELYITDGTAAATTLVADIDPGPSGSHPGSFTEFGGAVYFAASTADRGRELWRTDFSANGTTMVKDMVPGSGSASPNHMLVVGNTLYLLLGGPEEPSWSTSTDSAIRHRGAFSQLWKTDGTAAGTVLVKDLHSAGPAWARNDTPGRRWMAAVGNTLFFTGVDGNGAELWVSDGTTAGTVMVKDIAPGAASSTPDELIAFNGKVYFAAADGAGGTELWCSDGTAAGTSMLLDILPGSVGAEPTHLYVWQGRLYFSARTAIRLEHLWVSDGTAAGTVPFSSMVAGVYDKPREFVERGGKLLFSAFDGTNSPVIYETDGTAAGTGILVYSAMGSLGQASSLAVMNGNLFFIGSTQAGRRVFRFMGLHQPLLALPGGTDPGLVTTGQRLVYGGYPGAKFAVEPWGSDGSYAGTGQLADLARTPTGANASAFTDFGFTKHPIPRGDRVAVLVGTTSPMTWWESDGTGAGTQRAPEQNQPIVPTLFRGLHYDVRDDARYGRELWQSDGTANGTRLLRDIRPGAEGSNPSGFWLTSHVEATDVPSFVEVGGVLYFTADDGTNGRELWRTDGTSAGTVMVGDLAPGSAASHPFAAVGLGGELLFATVLESGGRRTLHATDGTAAGTRMVYDFGSQHSYVQTPLVRVGTRVVFSAIGPMGVEPWVTDGTSQGTSVLRDVHPGATGSDATAYTPIGALAVFRADDGIHGAELWRTDGTAAGTTLLKDIATGPRGSEISWLTPHAGVVYFCAQGVDGAELWRTDGTAAGTVQAVDIEPFGSSHPAQLVSVGRRYLWFSAWTHRYGRELWRSDGSAAGTRRFSDIMPGERDSLLGRVEPIVAFDNRLLFIAEAPLAGRELHAVFDLHAIARRSGAGCGAGGAVPQLTAADPVQGQPLQLDLDAAPAGRAGMLLLGLPMPGGHLGGGCTLFVDPAVAVAHPFRTDAAGRWQLGNTIIPNLPILRGVTVAAQVGVDSPATAPLGVALSGGWRLTIDPK